MSSNNILQRLRAATAAAHLALQERIDAEQMFGTRSGRPALVQRYYELHASADRAIEPWLQPIPNLDYAARRRSPALADDLRALGLDTPCPTGLRTLAVTGRSEALGILYVLEGSTLGGRTILRSLSAQGHDVHGLSFLDPYGAETGNRWRDFVAVLQREGVRDPAGVERGGVRGFEHARTCLVAAGETVS